MNKFDVTKPVQTREGRKARIICTNRTWEVVAGSKWPIVALISSASGNEELLSFREDGTATNSQFSLVNIPEETKFYRILFSDGKISITQYATISAAAFDVSLYPPHLKETFIGYQETVLIDGEVTAFNIIKKEA